MNAAPSIDDAFGFALAGLVGLALLASTWARLETAKATVAAVLRAGLQLTIVAGVLGLAFANVWSSAAFAGLMFVAASVTSAGRVGARRDGAWVAVALFAGVAPVLMLIFLSGSTPFQPAAIVAICGIVIGGSMTACSLAVRRAFGSIRDHLGQVEAGLALGLGRAQAIGLLIDGDRNEALVPILDQTRTVGLVTLPGAFVGVLLGGGSAAEAAAAQILVLVGLLAAETITVVVASRLVAHGHLLSEELRARLPVR